MSQPNEAAGAGAAWRSNPAAPPAPPTTARRGGWMGLAGAGIAVATMLFVALVRMIVGIPKVSQDYYRAIYSFEDAPIIWLLLGLLLMASIVPIAVAVVLGHVGVSRAKAAGTSAAPAGIALGVGYTLLVFWGVRLVNAIVNVTEFHGGFRMFIEYIGLWA